MGAPKCVGHPRRRNLTARGPLTQGAWQHCQTATVNRSFRGLPRQFWQCCQQLRYVPPALQPWRALTVNGAPGAGRDDEGSHFTLRRLTVFREARPRFLLPFSATWRSRSSASDQ